MNEAVQIFIVILKQFKSSVAATSHKIPKGLSTVKFMYLDQRKSNN